MRLRKPCLEHDRYEEHAYYDTDNWDGPKGDLAHAPIVKCSGGVFLPDDTLVIEKDPDEQWDRELVLDAVLDFLDREEVEETP